MKDIDKHPLDDEVLDELWIAAAARLGFRVERTTEAYASADGRGTVYVGTADTLDADDSVAQLVLHELCHALVQGEANLRLPDWGLDNTSERDLCAEHACLRLQAHLADQEALRALLAPTTVSRAYYASLPPFPLAGDQQAAALARRAARWAGESPWRGALGQALATTAEIVSASGRWTGTPGVHPLGGALGTPGRSCAGCAWGYHAHGGVLRCRQSAGRDGNGHRVRAAFPACARWEPALDCRACAACCRQGFDRVTVGVREAVVWRHPALVVRGGPRFELARVAGRCAGLQETPGGEPAFTCTVHDDRPLACREVLPGDRRCLAARRRIGLGAGS
jgi:Putative zinc- or iron-chelating domain